MRSFIFTAIILTFINSAYGQASPNAKPTATPKASATPIAVKTNLLVVDDSNSIVYGLSQSDVKVFEDGVEQKLTSFKAKEPGLLFSFVIDNSGSLREQLKTIERLGKVIVENFGPKDEASVIRFVSRDKIETMVSLTDDKAELIDAFKDMYVEGGQSAIIDALYVAAQQMLTWEKLAPTRKFAILLISDGEERSSYYNEKQFYEFTAKSDIQIFSIGFSEQLDASKGQKEKAGDLMRRVAVRSGGSAYQLPKKSTTDDLATLLKSLIFGLRAPYAIAYTSTNQINDAHPRKITVEIAPGPKGEKRTAIVQENVIIPKD